jgi:hypothetical protein
VVASLAGGSKQNRVKTAEARNCDEDWTLCLQPDGGAFARRAMRL